QGPSKGFRNIMRESLSSSDRGCRTAGTRAAETNVATLTRAFRPSIPERLFHRQSTNHDYSFAQDGNAKTFRTVNGHDATYLLAESRVRVESADAPNKGIDLIMLS